ESLTTTTRQESNLSPFTGSQAKTFNNNLCNQVMSTVWIGEASQEKAQERWVGSLAAMGGIKPTDEVEGMITAQLVATHHAIMECYRRSMIPEQSFEGRQESLNQATKLSRAFGGLLETLNRYRGKNHSEQKVIVEHVHVHSGGQAIVGNVQPK